MKKQPLIYIALFALLLAACSTAAPTPDASATAGTQDVAPESAETAAPTAAEPDIADTTSPGADAGLTCSLPLPSEQDWPVTLCETFADNQNDWLVESQDNDYANYSIDVVDGAYTLDYTAKAFAAFQRTALSWFPVSQAQDFALSVTTLMDTDFQSASWGVAFRASENMDSFFVFSIYNDGTYAFEIYENNNWIALISKRVYDGIQPGEPNKLTVVAEGGDFTFYINDVLVNIFSGGLLEDSGIQLLVSANEGASVVYTFDDIVLQSAP
ncbi:MAG: hypothetical protein PWQ55_588 [Chloroflexota bacterium]|nr:hypothetical protein [Chloroflexota bacterium]